MLPLLNLLGVVLGAASLGGAVVAFFDWTVRGRYNYRPVEAEDRADARRLRQGWLRFLILHNEALRWTGLLICWGALSTMLTILGVSSCLIGRDGQGWTALSPICEAGEAELNWFVVALGAGGAVLAMWSTMWNYVVSLEKTDPPEIDDE